MNTLHNQSSSRLLRKLILRVCLGALILMLLSAGRSDRVFALDESNPYPGIINVYYACNTNMRWSNQDIESYERDTLPNEWFPTWPEHSLKAGAVLVRTVGWERQRDAAWENYHGWGPGRWISTQNGDATCSARQNFRIGTQNTIGNNSPYGTNNAINNTFSLYIGSTTSVSSIGYGGTQQFGSLDKANSGERFIEIVRDYYGGAQPQPIAIDSGGATYGQIEGAYYGFGDPVGHPYNNGGTEYVHRWGPGSIQDFRTAPFGGTPNALMIPDVFDGYAFWVPGGIWISYLAQGGGGGWMGYPLGNMEFVQSSTCGGGLVNGQKFQAGYVIWKCNSNSYVSTGYSSSNVSVYFDINYSGAKTEYFLTGAPDLRNNYIGNDALSSLRVPAGCSVTLYQDIQYGGQYITFNGSVADLRAYGCTGCSGDNSWNDAASSLTVYCSNP